MRLHDFARGAVSRGSAEVLGGRYRLDGLLGSGGAADVHRGFDLRLRRPVAVKVFRAGVDGNAEEGLHGEAVVLARLHHPGLVAAYDAGQHDGRGFLVMQLVEGGTLKGRIARGPLSPEETAATGAGLARALAHAHEAEVVHRDVKPSNILLDTAHRPHLADFGISRMLDATTRTATGTLVGTAAYLSPEQVLGRPVGRPTDVYALGLVLLECLTGRLEYDGAPLESAIARLHRQPVLPHWIPERLSALLDAMTALDEQDRPTALDCAHALAASAGEALVADGPSANSTSLVAGPGPSSAAEDTHTNPSPAGKRTSPRRTSARGRALAAGTTVALAAVAVTTLTVTDGSQPRGDGRSATGATGAPTGRPDPSTGPVHGKSATPSPATPSSVSGRTPSSVPGTSVGVLSGSTAAHRPAAARERTAPAGTSTSVPEVNSRRTTEPPHRPPGQAGKAGQAEKGEKATSKGRRKKAAKSGP
ncbi:protein kinase domain-containing protein [Streptomyces sp. cmx-4-25]|uniref:serine/threonine-protein kinase n=1 Tax=unclassified Streptomyces TaxID=2593676 RepID=UPI003980FB0E